MFHFSPFSACSFINGEWSACDPVTNQMTKVDILRPGSADYCNKTRILSKKCGKKGKSELFSYFVKYDLYVFNSIAKPHSSVGSVQDLRTGSRWFDPWL